MTRLEQMLARIDELNRSDPRTERIDGNDVPYELAYARRMTAWLERRSPDASEELRIAARAQHVCRWKIPRSEFPEGRAGYKRWRSTLARMHAELTAAEMERVGYPDASIERVSRMLQKRGLRVDDDTQALEDVACLVFIEHYFTDFAAKHPHDKVVDIVGKTWNKMSPRGHELALAAPLPEATVAIMREALDA